MSFRILAIGLLSIGCASTGAGVTKDESLRITASHYESLTGVAVTTGAGPMTCNRDMITGSHILRWYCRSAGDPMQYQLGSPIVLVLR